MALRADTARHIITGATVLIFSAAAIGTAMRYQGGGLVGSMAEDAELPAEASATASLPGAPAPMQYSDGRRGIGSDVGIKLDNTTALAGSATMWPFRDGPGAGAMGGAAWWSSPKSRLTPTSTGGGGGGGGGSLGAPGSGYGVSGGARGKGPGPAAAGPKPKSGSGKSGGNSGKGNGGMFDEHSSSVEDLADDKIEDDLLGGIPGAGAGIIGGGDMSHTPEPASLLLMATGLAGVIEAARRRQNRRR